MEVYILEGKISTRNVERTLILEVVWRTAVFHYNIFTMFDFYIFMFYWYNLEITLKYIKTTPLLKFLDIWIFFISFFLPSVISPIKCRFSLDCHTAEPNTQFSIDNYYWAIRHDKVIIKMGISDLLPILFPLFFSMLICCNGNKIYTRPLVARLE